VRRIRFAFCVHSHQPTGNLEHVVQNAYERAYRPFLEAVRESPHVKVVLHYSGSLLTWIEENRPELFEDISALVREGRAELLTGGFHEPILPLIPDRDKIGQIAALTDYLRTHFGADPKGLWLTERVWQPDLVAPLRRADVRYTIVDDNNFESTGLAEEESLGHFVARGPDGQTIEVFPINAVLRKAIPFQPPEAVIDHLSRLAGDGDRVAVWADDGEKLGEWPGTHDLVYRQGWLARFFELLAENREWLQVTTLGEALEATHAQAEVDLPPGSYEEMMEWSDGAWRNFLARYEESNIMYRKMLLVSDAVAGAGEKARAAARDHLYRGQSNDAYWHGTFGGLYLLHLRTNTYRDLLRAESLVARDGRVRVRQTDFDGDGREEVLVTSPFLDAYLHQNGGQIFELDHRGLPWNVLATLTRRREPYHDEMAEMPGAPIPPRASPDWYLRRALIDHFLRDDTDIEAFARCQYGEQGDFVNQPYETDVKQHAEGSEVALERRGGVWVGAEFVPVTVRKHLRFSPEGPQVRVNYEIACGGVPETDLWFGCENNFVLSAGNAPGRYLRVEGCPDKLPLDAKTSHDRVRELSLVDEWLGGSVSLRFGQPTAIWTFPVQTLSRGLEGPALSYQCTSVLAHWRLTLPPHQPREISFEIALGGCGASKSSVHQQLPDRR